MIRHIALQEYFRYNDWARARLLALCAPLSDAQLDRPFEMGEGSLRATLYHLWAAEYAWLNRWQPRDNPPYVADCRGESVAEIGRRFDETETERDAFLAGLNDENLQRAITYTSSKGVTSTFTLGQMMLHVCTHGVHHRAQAINMLRHVGGEVPKPGLDYVFMKVEQADEPPPQLDRGTLGACYAHSDWAQAKVQAAAARLTDAQLDQPCEIGAGTLRRSLVHIRDAEQWWFENWTLGPGRPFPAPEGVASIAEIAQRFDQTRTARQKYFERLTDGDLLRPTTATPRPGVYRTFPLGVTMLQLCCHGTHTRVQALNMLRHHGAAVPTLDYAAMLRELHAK